MSTSLATLGDLRALLDSPANPEQWVDALSHLHPDHHQAAAQWVHDQAARCIPLDIARYTAPTIPREWNPGDLARAVYTHRDHDGLWRNELLAWARRDVRAMLGIAHAWMAVDGHPPEPLIGVGIVAEGVADAWSFDSPPDRPSEGTRGDIRRACAVELGVDVERIQVTIEGWMWWDDEAPQDVWSIVGAGIQVDGNHMACRPILTWKGSDHTTAYEALATWQSYAVGEPTDGALIELGGGYWMRIATGHRSGTPPIPGPAALSQPQQP